MEIRKPLLVACLVGLSACAPQIPDSGRPVGFDNSLDAERARNAQLEQSQIRVPDTVLPPENYAGVPPPVTGVEPLPGSAEATALETTRILEETRPSSQSSTVTAGAATTQAFPTSTLPVQASPNNAGISQENNFDVVAGQRSIEGDAERLAQNRAQYEVIQPEALPQRTETGQPNIVSFALQTSHPIGERVYSRAGFNGEARAKRNCAKYPSSDQAQIDFLARGGPARDRRGLDPDGDGYACSWDPTPFRKAAQG